MYYVADTHALVFYLLGKLPKKIDTIFKSIENSEAILFIPTIVLAECFYLIKKGKIDLDFKNLIKKIEECNNFVIIPFNSHILKLFLDMEFMELHDLIIVSTTKYLGAKLLSKDKDIFKSKKVEVIW